MDLATLFGIISAFGLILSAIFSSSGIDIFINVPSFFIVIGGTLGATFVNYTFSEVFEVIRILKYAFFTKTEDYFEKIGFLIYLSVQARREGILSLEKEVDNMNDTFLQRGTLLAIDGADENTIKEILTNELYFAAERHKFGYEVLSSMGAYSPAMGLIGTLIGLVQMLQNLNNPRDIGPSMAVALLTTFYGAILANLIFLPLSGKLKRKSQKELLFREVCIEGILGISKGENPKILENRLLSFFRDKEKENYGEK